MIWTFFLVLTELVNFQPTGKTIYNQKFGQLDDDTPLINKFINLIPSFEDFDSGNQLVGKIQFVYSGYDDLLFVICADRTENIGSILEALENMKVAFREKFINIVKEGKTDPSFFSSFRDDVNKALSSLVQPEAKILAQPTPVSPPAQVAESTSGTTSKKMVKIAFVGNKNVGKRTCLNLLLGGSPGSIADESDMMMKKGPISNEYNSLLITLPNPMIESGKTQFLSNTDVVLFVTESVFKDVMATRKIYEIIKPILPRARFGVIANKQDVSGAVEVDAIKKVYELPTIPMVGIDPQNSEMLKSFVIELVKS
ncbi:MAG: hypothetical protein ACFFD2_30035 [Promethearchaeota archaeon]